MSVTKTSPFNKDKELAEMKQYIADKSYNLKLKGYLISGALGLAGLGALFVFPGVIGMATPLVGIALAGGSAISAMATMKETKQLEIDEQVLHSRIQGKGYWRDGYNDEVLKSGNTASGIALHGGLPALGSKEPHRGS